MEFADVLADDAIDLVSVCTPNGTHADMVRAIISAGKNVICEKPLATTFDEAVELTELATAAGVVTAVPFVYRYHPLVAEARERLRRGDAGDIHLLHGSYLQDWLSSADDDNWRVDTSAGGASRAFADIGSHWCDIVEFVSGLRITEVSAVTRVAFADRGPSGAARPVSTEDIACVNLRFSNGAVGSVVISQVSPGRKNRLWFEISGTRATVGFDQEQPETMMWGEREGVETVVRDALLMSAPAAELSTLPSGHPMGYYDCFRSFVSDTLRVIAGEQIERLPTFRDGLRAAAVTHAVIASAQSSMWVTVAP